MTAPGVRHSWLAALRLALVPVVLLGERLVDHPVAHTGAFPFLLAAYGAWAAGLLGLQPRAARPRRELDRVEPFIDLAAIVALTYASGGPFSETATAFFVLPVLAAARLRPRVTAGWALGAIACFVLLSVVHPNASEADATGRIISQGAYLALVGAAATLVSYVLQRRDLAIARLAEQRGQLATHALTAEQRERRRLAELLHDESVQTLSVARQELVDYQRTGREASFERARSAIDETMAQLRGEIFELHPYVLDHAGLAAALNAIADRSAQRMGAEITVAVDPAAGGRHDELIVVFVRELLTNAVKHSGAAHVEITVAADAERVELAVRDDGRGFDPSRRAASLLDGQSAWRRASSACSPPAAAVAVAARRAAARRCASRCRRPHDRGPREARPADLHRQKRAAQRPDRHAGDHASVESQSVCSATASRKAAAPGGHDSGCATAPRRRDRSTRHGRPARSARGSAGPPRRDRSGRPIGSAPQARTPSSRGPRSPSPRRPRTTARPGRPEAPASSSHSGTASLTLSSMTPTASIGSAPRSRSVSYSRNPAAARPTIRRPEAHREGRQDHRIHESRSNR